MTGLLQHAEEPGLSTIFKYQVVFIAPYQKRRKLEPAHRIYSNEAGRGWKVREEYEHDMFNHLETYVEGNVHTNCIANFWSLLKRGCGGTYPAEPFHLFRYVDE